MQKLITLICFIACSIAISSMMMVYQANASETVRTIGCINSKTLQTKPVNSIWNCFYWKNWQNISLPPDSHVKTWKKLFKTERSIINRLPIVNFESSFDENAWNKWAKWYVQTLRAYKIPKDVQSQLKWMKNRQESQKTWNCKQHSKSEDRMMRCLYARHYGAKTGFDWYPNKAMVARQYYIDWFKNNKLEAFIFFSQT